MLAKLLYHIDAIAKLVSKSYMSMICIHTHAYTYLYDVLVGT